MSFDLHDPREKLDYTFDWSPFLDESGSPSDVVLTAEWTITPVADGSPTEPAITSESVGNPFTTCFVNGLERDVIYRLSCTATTSMGRTPEQSITIRGGER